ncbi:hypothetical protein [Bradyrhizobium sp. LHD-71]|uniref:hypothetical protein n=1 Tax=Bradyrhizobium sp. LHD-71 TaxID=3072141 RepID=UPI00280C3F88|nr:hypothetical protein [Bradyrhizobium sp. LHD-71]MDQ8732700.1 hypothetical protein [Bradyrhizobium sp. LHD-71]
MLWAAFEILATLAILLLLAFAVIAIPGFVSSIEKSDRPSLPKADRLVDRPNMDGCSHQTWPYFDRSCARSDEPPRAVKPQ